MAKTKFYLGSAVLVTALGLGYYHHNGAQTKSTPKDQAQVTGHDHHGSHQLSSTAAHDHLPEAVMPNPQDTFDEQVPLSAETLRQKQVQSLVVDLSRGLSTDAPSAQAFIQAGILDPMAAFHDLKEALELLEPQQGALRQSGFSLLIELGHQLKANSPQAEALAEAVADVVENELSLPEEIAIDSTALSDEALESMVHHGPYANNNGHLVYRTFETKFMALAALREIPAETTDVKFNQLQGQFQNSEDPIAQFLDMSPLPKDNSNQEPSEDYVADQ